MIVIGKMAAMRNKNIIMNLKAGESTADTVVVMRMNGRGTKTDVKATKHLTL